MIVIIVIFSTLATVSTKIKQHAVCKEERKSFLHAVSFQMPGNLFFFFGESVSCIGQTPIFYHRELIPTSIQEFVCSISKTKDHWLSDL